MILDYKKRNEFAISVFEAPLPSWRGHKQSAHARTVWAPVSGTGARCTSLLLRVAASTRWSSCHSSLVGISKITHGIDKSISKILILFFARTFSIIRVSKKENMSKEKSHARKFSTNLGGTLMHNVHNIVGVIISNTIIMQFRRAK